MYKALESFATKNYDVKRKQILADDFTTQDEINEFLEIGYIEEYDGTLEISENGMYDVKEYENADVNVSGSDPVLQSKSVTITENGTQTVSPDTGYDGLSSVSVTTDVAGSGSPYKRLECIESTGTQRINTGITPDNTTEFEIKYNQTAINGQFDAIIGGQQGNTGIFVMPTFNSTVHQKSLRYNTTENKTSTTNSYYQVDTTLTLKQNVFTFDNGTNQESITTGSYSSFSVAQPLWLFALNNGGTSFGLAKMKLYYCKIWKNNELVRDLIPVKMIESGNVGLWDKVNQEFLSNAGSGTFTAGAELPDEDEWYISSARYLFYEGARLKEKDNLLPLVKNATDFRSMFNGCSSLTSIDLRALDTSSATNFSSMFEYCSQLQSIDLSSFDTSNVTGMFGMFRYCGNIDTIILSNKWDMSKVTDISSMFEHCNNFTGENIDWSKFNTTSLQNMNGMFSGCSVLTTLPIFNTSNVNNMGGAFRDCPNLSNQSLNNILAMCIPATGIFTKTLKQVGLSQAQATTCQGLSNYQAFLDAGWTTGY